MVGLGTDTSTALGDDERAVMRVDLPVRPRKRMVFPFNCPEGPKDDCPLVVSPFGVYFRMDGLGGKFISGRSPPLVCLWSW